MTGMIEDTVSRARIAAVYPLITAHIRRTPVVEIAGADIGLEPTRVLLKLEQLQHSGSFKGAWCLCEPDHAAGSAEWGRCSFGR
jgi:threonine dehydratase